MPVTTPQKPKPMIEPRKQDPLHGITLKMVVTRLEQKYGWQELSRRITIKCFSHEPSISSSLKFLRKTPWARAKVEALYLQNKWPEDRVTRKPDAEANSSEKRDSTETNKKGFTKE